MSLDGTVTFTKDAGGADSAGSPGFASLDLIPVDIDMVLEFSIDFAEKFLDDAVLSLDDAGNAGSVSSAGSTGFALVFPLSLASSSGFLSIFFVGLVNVAKISFCFVS
jgi:hypothetical protein